MKENSDFMVWLVHFCVLVGYFNAIVYLNILEEPVRYAGLLLAPAEGFGLWSRVFFALQGKKKTFYAVLANFRPFLVSSSHLGNF